MTKMEKCLSVLKDSKSDNEKFAALLLVSGALAYSRMWCGKSARATRVWPGGLWLCTCRLRRQ